MTSLEWIYQIVSEFYLKARNDILIGYHFRHIHDFEEHIPRIVSFWEIQLKGKSTKKIDPPFDIIGAHRHLGIKHGELGRWLLLFRKTLEENNCDLTEFRDLKNLWEIKLEQFEKIFTQVFLPPTSQ